MCITQWPLAIRDRKVDRDEHEHQEGEAGWNEAIDLQISNHESGS